MLAKRASQIVAAVLILLLPSAADAEPRVVVTSKPIHALVASVLAEVAEPVLLVDGTASPHSYAMKPSDARKVHNAQILFRVSEGLEPSTAKLVAALPDSVQVVSLVEAPGLKRLPIRKGGTLDFHEHEHDRNGAHPQFPGAHNDHNDTGLDPHVWLDPDNAKAMVSYIADVLTRAAPDSAAVIRANVQAEIGKISALSIELEQDLASVADRPFLVYHDALQYFEKRFGLAAAGSVVVSPDFPASGKRLQELRSALVSSGAVCVFIEPYSSRRVAEVLVEGTIARIGTLDPEGTRLAPGPDLYRTLMRNLASDFKACLAGS